MKLRVTIEFDVKETERGFEALDDTALCLAVEPRLEDLVVTIAEMMEQGALTDDITVEVINVIGGPA